MIHILYIIIVKKVFANYAVMKHIGLTFLKVKGGITMKIEKLTKIKTEYATISPDNFQLMEKINEIIDVVNNIIEQPKEEDETSIAVNNPDAYRIGFADGEAHAKEEVDGFDAELNALLKKYEYLPKEELAECLEFYLGVVKNMKI